MNKLNNRKSSIEKTGPVCCNETGMPFEEVGVSIESGEDSDCHCGF